MTGSRAAILGAVRRSLGRGQLAAAQAETLERRLAAPARHIVPDRSGIDPTAWADLFVAMAREAAATVDRVAAAAEVPAALAAYLARENLPSELAMAPDPALDDVPWAERPLLGIRRGAAAPGDQVGVTGAFAAVAETGTLMLVSGPESPTTLNFLPETHVVVLWRQQVVGAYEDGWDRLRRRGDGASAGGLPRTVNFITGPSRSADIEQTLLMGAHGPRRLHIILIDGGPV